MGSNPATSCFFFDYLYYFIFVEVLSYMVLGIFSMVDRYKYLHLWPCTEGELESFSWSAHTVCNNKKIKKIPLLIKKIGYRRDRR